VITSSFAVHYVKLSRREPRSIERILSRKWGSSRDLSGIMGFCAFDKLSLKILS